MHRLQAMAAGTIHTSASRFSCEEPVVAEAFTAAVLEAACRQSAPIRRALHCVLDVDNVRLMRQRDVDWQLTAVEAGSLPQLIVCYPKYWCMVQVATYSCCQGLVVADGHWLRGKHSTTGQCASGRRGRCGNCSKDIILIAGVISLDCI